MIWSFALIGGACVCANPTLIKSFQDGRTLFFIALCTLHSFLCFFCLIVFMHWQVQYLDFPEYQLRALWTSVVNMHRHTHFHLDVVGDYVVVIAACVSGVWFKWYRFIAFIYSATQLVFRSAFFLRSPHRSDGCDRAGFESICRRSVDWKAYFFFDTVGIFRGWVCVCVARPLLFLCVLRGCCSV